MTQATTNKRAWALAYRWWPTYDPNCIGVASPSGAVVLVASALALGAVLSLPLVSRATGIGPFVVAGLLLPPAVWSCVGTFVLRPWRPGPAWRFHLTAAGNLLINTAVVTLLPALAGDPKGLLWIFPVFYACCNGALKHSDPSFAILATHVTAPILTIPIFFARGADPTWSIVGPLLCAVLSLISYHFFATMAAESRQIARERDAAVSRWHAAAAELQRRHLAQDLHDSVGSSLSFAALYGDLVEQHANEPAELRRIADTLRDATKEGLLELRGVLEAIAPRATDLRALASILGSLGDRAAAASRARIAVELRADGAAIVSGAVRLAVVRIFQEAIRNAIVHGHAARIDVVLSLDDEQLELDVRDDGAWIDPLTPAAGRGLPGMRRRAEELGGSFELSAEAERGTVLRVRLPSGEPQPSATQG